jgi:hypothetical protein
MSGYRRRLLLGVGIVCLVGFAGPASAAETLIDEFSSGKSTRFRPNKRVAQDVVGSTTITDANLPDVIGGSRTLTVEAQSLLNMGEDLIVVGVVPIASFLQYDSTAQAEGRFDLLYDANGAGLGIALTPALGIRVVVLDADVTAAPYDVMLTLTDGNLISASSTQTVSVPGPALLHFAFSSFAGVNARNIFSLRLKIDPLNPASDLRLERIETYGTPVTLPVTSPLGLGLLAAALLVMSRARLTHSPRHRT